MSSAPFDMRYKDPLSITYFPFSYREHFIACQVVSELIFNLLKSASIW
jgi:hypothetical protein